jgi:protein-tyrosine phosphatase
MAEFIFKDLIKNEGLENDFFISSSATSTEEIYMGIGNPVYPPAKAELLKHNISCDGKRAVQLKKSDYDKYDYFVGMDSANIRNMHIILGGDKDEKISKLLDHTDKKGDVSDPWYTDRFDIAYSDILRGCKALFNELRGKNGKIKEN